MESREKKRTTTVTTTVTTTAAATARTMRRWSLLMLCCSVLSLPLAGALSRNRDQAHKDISVITAELNRRYHNVSSSNREHQFVYRLRLESANPPRAVRLRTEINGGDHVNSVYPLRIDVRFNQGTLNWLVPYESGGVRYAFVERTLCLFEERQFESLDQTVTVVVTTASAYGIDYTLVLSEVRDFAAKLNQRTYVTNVEVPTPQYRYIDLRRSDENRLLQLKVTSGDSVCAYVSLQPADCPVSDTQESVKTEGAFQTMLGTAAFNIDQERFGSGAIVVFVVTANDRPCGPDYDLSIDRKKDFEFELSDGISRGRVARLVATATGLLSLLCIFAIFMSCFCSAHGKQKKVKSRVERVHEQRRMESASAVDGLDKAGEEEDREEASYPRTVDQLSTMAAKERKYKVSKMFQKSELYIWMVATVSLFYGVPAIQLVLNHNAKQQSSGDQDLCYYNFLCAVPAGIFNNFNNIFSNIYYFVFGLLFIILTWHRKRQYHRFLGQLESRVLEDEDPSSESWGPCEFGIPQHFGIFYAMGLAMIMESLFSASYHVCPTDENFQFDTTFMYTIASLSFIKLYQFRHPDISSSAYKVFLGIGLVLFSEAVGLFYGNTAYWVITLLLYFLLIVCLGAVLYHPGEWSFGRELFVNMTKSVQARVRKDHEPVRRSRKRLILVLSLSILNLVLLVLGAVVTPDGVSSYILVVFIVNLLAYAIYYVIMKVRHRERMTLSARFYGVLATLSWAFAMWFYTHVDYDTRLSPAQSRDMNAECYVLDMYDHHDVWHMFSAMGLFHVFMLFLNLDDGLYDVPRNKIKIF